MYNTREDLHLRLSTSIILLEEQPIFIESVTEQKALMYYTLTKLVTKGPQRLQRISYNSPKLDYKPFALGYYNTEQLAHYVSRMPNRYYKQGLTYRSVVSPTMRLDTRTFPIVINELCKNSYPSLNEVFNLLNTTCLQSAAFHKFWAIEKAELGVLYLTYKTRKVGWFNAQKEVHLAKDFLYLTENLQAVKVPLANCLQSYSQPLSAATQCAPRARQASRAPEVPRPRSSVHIDTIEEYLTDEIRVQHQVNTYRGRHFT